MQRFQRALCAAALAAAPVFAHAIDGITDPTGDLLGTFGGSAASKDLDVVSASVFYDPNSNFFKLVATMDGTIGTTANNLYVWGVNRGAGVATFAANGFAGVRFDRTVQLKSDGTGAIGGVALAPGSVIVTGKTITAFVSATLLTSTGFQAIDYTWNLWPRDQTYAGFAAISDFAPDNANFSTTLGTVTPVPEPAGIALLTIGLGLVGWRARRSNRRS